MRAVVPVLLAATLCACDGTGLVAGGDDDDAPEGDGGGGSDGGGGGGADLPPDPLATAPGVVVYWGQNGYGATRPGEPATWEPPLAEVCANPAYDVVVLGFVIAFDSARNGNLPELNLSFHCETAVDAAHPYLLRCPEIEAGIATCHRNGKKVLMSLGGAAGAYGFTSDAGAEQFATTVWDLFLGGSHPLRPFGAAVLDGVDLDIEGGSATGYAAFARALRTRMDLSGEPYLITAAPQCPFPDAHLGPAPGRALGDAASAFDYVFVQFYNNYCAASAPTAFADTFAQWSALAGAGGPRVVVGLPATPAAAPAGGYLAPADLPALISRVRQSPAFAGVMLWDASFDRHSGEPTYGVRAAQLLAP